MIKKLKKGLKIATFKEDMYELLDSKFHVTMLTPAIIGIIIFTMLPNNFYDFNCIYKL